MSVPLSDSNSPEELWISWAEYHQKIEHLAHRIYQSQWIFDTIICIARGGLRIGDILSRLYDKPLAVLSAQSYSGEAGRDRRELAISGSLSIVSPRLGPTVLLVDDLADSGITLHKTTQWLKANYHQDIQSLKTATLWCKGCSTFKPDYYVDFLPQNPWIHQPFEQYDAWSFPEFFS